MAYHGSFPSHGENHHDLKSGRDIDPDKLECITSCLENETKLTFAQAFFWILVPDSQLLQPTIEL